MDALMEGRRTVLETGWSADPLLVDEVWDIDQESEEDQNENDPTSTLRIADTTRQIRPFLRVRMANEKKTIDG